MFIGLLSMAAVVPTCAQENYSAELSDSMTINEVVVKAQRPKTKLTGNSMVTSVEGTVLSRSGTVREMLAKVPGMMEKAGELEVVGRGTPIYYVNGRRLYDTDELKRLHSEDIKEVEVITNPGSQYDATVSAVVRIKTVRPKGQGFGFDLVFDSNNDLRYGHYDPDAQANLRYRWNNFDVFGMVNMWSSTRVQDSWLNQNSCLLEPSSDLLHIDQNSYWIQTHKYRGLNSNLGFNWQINENHSVGMRIDRSGDFYNADIDMHQETYVTHWLERNPDERNTSHSHTVEDNSKSLPYNWTGNAYYAGQWGKLGVELNVDLINSKKGEDAHINERNDHSDINEITSASPSHNRMIANKLVLSYPVWKGNLQVGTEMTFVERQSKYTIQGMALPSTDSKVEEDNIAAFAQYACQIPLVGSLSAGVRFEHVGFDYFDNIDPTQSLRRKSDDIFPSIAWARRWGSVQTSLNYSIKTQRPSYWMLTETKTYINPYSLQQGDPKLKNEMIQQVGINARWKWLTLTSTYTHKKDALSQWSYIYNHDGIILLKNINLDVPVRNKSVYLSASPTWGCYSPNWTVGFLKPKVTLHLADPRLGNALRTVRYSKPLGIFNLNNTFEFKHSWLFECNVGILTKGDYINYRFRRNTYDVGLVVEKCWLKDDALSVRAEVSNLFQHMRQLTELDCGYYTLLQNCIYNEHRFDLSVRYTFNAAKSKYKGTGAGREAAQRMNS